jgi:tRNA-specific 2-thiouridylase
VDTLALEHHLTSPQGLDHVPDEGFTVTRGGGSCCDSITLSVALRDGLVADAGFSAQGCGSATAAGSAVVSLVRGLPVLHAARISATDIATELGGLSPGKLHAADLAADALGHALGGAVRQAGGAVLPRPSEGRVLVAMSGGVDSALAAYLCAQVGETVAVTLELWSDAENDAERSCCSASAASQARALAHAMGLAHLTLDLREEFRRGVVAPFIAGYTAGETPNPCVGCNGHVRLDALIEFGGQLGCDHLATGHYARLAEVDDERGPLLRVAADPAKDQTYMLAALGPGSLARMQFPLGDLTKAQVRERAAEVGLPVAAKPDSQDLCFLAGTDRARFLARHGGVGDRPGPLVDGEGRRLGSHAGQHRFTVGQRRGLGVASTEPLYVLDRDAASNRVVVGPAAALARERVRLRGVTLRREGTRVDRVKLRYRSPALPAVVEPAEVPPGMFRNLDLRLAEAAHGVAPGQLACLMDGELVVGWGTIARG